MTLPNLFRTTLYLVLFAGSIALANETESGSESVDVQALAASIDKVIDAKLQELGQASRPGIDDYAFARRAHLDLIGRIPTLSELQTFIADPAPDKRAVLISTLLKSKGYNSHLTNYWADLLRVKTIGDQLHHAGNLMQAIKTAVRENKPYDEIAREVVGARGRLYQKGNGFAGFKSREPMQLDRLANTTKTFLGLGIDCAQCHDHPFDDWTQKEFYQLAAFTSGVKYRADPPPPLERQRYAKIRKVLKHESFDTWIVYRESLRMKYANIEGTGTGYQRLPHDYQYEDGTPHQVMAATVLFGDTPDLKYAQPKQVVAKHKNKQFAGPDIGAQATFAEWLASPENPMFNKTTANRLWKWVMGSELVGPVGGLELSSKGPHPELTATMISVLQTVDYDMRAFFEILLNTQAYQRRAIPVHADAPDYVLDAPLVRRLSAEATWDSVLSLRVAEPDRYVPTTFFYDGFTHFNEKTQTWTAKDFETYSRESKLTRGRFYQVAHREASKRNRDPGKPHERRASECEHVAHGAVPAYVEFSKLFGASTRELLDGANTDPSIPQVLYLMNGTPETELITGNSLLNQNLRKARPAEKFNQLWLSIFSRPITPAEVAIANRAGRTPTGLQDLAWALVNANEFRFIH